MFRRTTLPLILPALAFWRKRRRREESADFRKKALHRILKLWFEPDERMHEVKTLGSVADVRNSEGVTEIQTRSLARLAPKLEKFLPEVPVRVVYPLPYTKILHWVSPETGEISEGRKSPKKATVYDALYELYNLRPFLAHPNFTLMLAFLHVEEYRFRSGRGKDKKHWSTRMERIPNRVEKLLAFQKPSDYFAFLPDGLPSVFTRPMYTSAVSPGFRYAFSGISILQSLGLIEECGKLGRAKAYKIKESESDRS